MGGRFTKYMKRPCGVPTGPWTVLLLKLRQMRVGTQCAAVSAAKAVSSTSPLTISVATRTASVILRFISDISLQWISVLLTTAIVHGRCWHFNKIFVYFANLALKNSKNRNKTRAVSFGWHNLLCGTWSGFNCFPSNYSILQLINCGNLRRINCICSPHGLLQLIISGGRGRVNCIRSPNALLQLNSPAAAMVG